MAAVAGSKGRLEFGDGPPGLQIALVDRLLAGSLTAGDAAQMLVGDARLREVGIDTNMICNLKCSYCYLDDRPEAQGSAPLDQLGDTLVALARADTRLFAFIGKEPLADERAIYLLEHLRNERGRGLKSRTGLVTNGTLVPRWIERLADADPSYIDISIDGLSDVENRLRGDSVAKRALAGVNAVVRSPLRSRFATATVLTDASMDAYPDFVSSMLDRGVPTCFSSPVLRFAMSNDVAAFAVSLEETLRLADRLASVAAPYGQESQIIIDLPYRYSWALLSSGRAPIAELGQDRFEALFWKWNGSQVYFKLNPFPYSFWRALRITHDGRVIINMDLAAHVDYRGSALDLGHVTPGVFTPLAAAALPFLSDFIMRHLAGGTVPLFERGLQAQYERENVRAAA